MGRRTQIDRADLLKCLQAQDEAQWEGTAAALGYVRREAPKPPPAPSRVAPQSVPPPSDQPDELPKPAVSAAPPRACFYRVVAQRRLEPAEVVREAPDWFRDAVPFEGEEEIRAEAGLSPPPQPPLMLWPRLWPFLKTVLSDQQATRALDVPRVIERLARMRTLRHLPRKPRRGWAAECQVIVDYAPPLLPFWSDFNRLYQDLWRLRGRQGLKLIAFPEGVPGGPCWIHAGRTWQEIDSYPMPGSGKAVLVLSDLGCIDKTNERRHQWHRLGARLQRADCRLVALMPCPPRWWDRDLTRLFYPVCWDRAERLPRRIDARRMPPALAERADQDAGAERLLALLAPAIRIEPALLRAVRYLLPAWEADVGSEAAAWNHPRVHATPMAFYYDSEAVAEYRDRFKSQDKDLRRRIADLITAHHAHLSPAIGYEERLLLAGLEEAFDPDARQFIERIVKTLHSRDNALAGSVSGWVRRLTLRQQRDRELWKDEALVAARLIAHLGQLQEGKMFPVGVGLSRLSWLLALGQAARRYTLRQRGPALYLEADAPATFEGELDAPGSPLADIDAAAPYVQFQRLEADSPPGDEQQIQPFGRAIPLHPDGCLRVRTDHQELDIDSLTKPDWAEAIGRDEYGLYADFRIQGVYQRLRWIAPGEFLMGSPVSEAERGSDERQHRVILTRGYWLADTACTQALWQVVMGDNPSHFKGAGRPVESVNWENVQAFIERLNELVPGGGFGLPTEAEWEYACRAGTATAFWFGDQITLEQANYDGNYPYAGGKQGQYRQQTVEVKALPCNRWGLYQMHGNVWEWCQDWYSAYSSRTAVDPMGPDEGGERVLRGGCWINYGRALRSARRYAYDPGNRDVSLGFRLARGQAAGRLAPEARKAGEERGAGQTTRSGVGQALRDGWKRRKA